MEKIFKGLLAFQDHVFPEYREDFHRLGTRQNPEALLITCADSRIDPALITQSRPGDLFICRNAGNIVPGHGPSTGGVSATIEYAIRALGIRDVIICGHSDCGAMKGVIYPELVKEMPSVASWLNHAGAVRSILKENYGNLEGGQLLRAAIQENVLVQLDNLRNHPAVAAPLRRGDLRVHGWVYEIETGHVFAWDPEKKEFASLRKLRRPSSRAGRGNGSRSASRRPKPRSRPVATEPEPS